MLAGVGLMTVRQCRTPRAFLSPACNYKRRSAGAIGPSSVEVTLLTTVDTDPLGIDVRVGTVTGGNGGTVSAGRGGSVTGNVGRVTVGSVGAVTR
jgi:hypothetical protein